MSDTPRTDAVWKEAGNASVDIIAKLLAKSKELERELAAALKAKWNYEKLMSACDEHKPIGGGARSGCVICAIEKLQSALSQIDYLCDAPNEMEVSSYDVHYNESAVVDHVKTLRKAKEEAERDAQRYRWLHQYLVVAADNPDDWTCWLALECVPTRSKESDAETLLDELITRFPIDEAMKK